MKRFHFIPALVAVFAVGVAVGIAIGTRTGPDGDMDATVPGPVPDAAELVPLPDRTPCEARVQELRETSQVFAERGDYDGARRILQIALMARMDTDGSSQPLWSGEMRAPLPPEGGVSFASDGRHYVTSLKAFPLYRRVLDQQGRRGPLEEELRSEVLAEATEAQTLLEQLIASGR